MGVKLDPKIERTFFDYLKEGVSSGAMAVKLDPEMELTFFYYLKEGEGNYARVLSSVSTDKVL